VLPRSSTEVKGAPKDSKRPPCGACRHLDYCYKGSNGYASGGKGTRRSADQITTRPPPSTKDSKLHLIFLSFYSFSPTFLFCSYSFFYYFFLFSIFRLQHYLFRAFRLSSSSPIIRVHRRRHIQATAIYRRKPKRSITNIH